MAKWLFFGLLAFVVYRMWMLRGSHQAAARPAGPVTPPVQQIVACDHCGVDLPDSESLKESGRHYCCEQHRAAERADPHGPGKKH